MCNNGEHIIKAVTQHFVEHQIPRAQLLAEKVEQNEMLDNEEIAFLNEFIEEHNLITPLLARQPAFQQTALDTIEMVKRVVKVANENKQVLQHTTKDPE
ncbi:hypothetical protein [Teredinibacter sp. KSP-S5-2]|uniref:hypothetical protein n=1 Tax=Teredinibacter sp. KSP-S5-2 TaxID=3034506 RepID=UPI002935329D|nr:hypothetical protein [Teredinibacter sp. KSP-S5-2]WNO07528.1 hypothetical protein P5V12_11050 [Teredinibacter sp. KSP-S5-2]